MLSAHCDVLKHINLPLAAYTATLS